MLTKEISEVEKEMLKDAIIRVLDSEEHKLFIKIFPTIIKTHIKIKDEALKSAQAKFNRFVEDLKEGMKPIIENECKGTPANCYKIKKGIFTLMDELSSKQEGKDGS
jgi:hypothetical protein